MFNNTKSHKVFAKDALQVGSITKRARKYRVSYVMGSMKKINNTKYNLYDILNYIQKK